MCELYESVLYEYVGMWPMSVLNGYVNVFATISYAVPWKMRDERLREKDKERQRREKHKDSTNVCELCRRNQKKNKKRQKGKENCTILHTIKL